MTPDSRDSQRLGWTLHALLWLMHSPFARLLPGRVRHPAVLALTHYYHMLRAAEDVDLPLSMVLPLRSLLHATDIVTGVAAKYSAPPLPFPTESSDDDTDDAIH